MSENSNGPDAPRLGATVDSPDGPGTVTDRDMDYGQALVRLKRGTVLDTSHGVWLPFGQFTVTGFDPDALVWDGPRQVPASDVPVRRNT